MKPTIKQCRELAYDNNVVVVLHGNNECQLVKVTGYGAHWFMPTYQCQNDAWQAAWVMLKGHEK